jgi:hypothetical protein
MPPSVLVIVAVFDLGCRPPASAASSALYRHLRMHCRIARGRFWILRYCQKVHANRLPGPTSKVEGYTTSVAALSFFVLRISSVVVWKYCLLDQPCRLSNWRGQFVSDARSAERFDDVGNFRTNCRGWRLPNLAELEVAKRAAIRLRHIAGTAWSTKRYLSIELLKNQQMRGAITA